MKVKKLIALGIAGLVIAASVPAVSAPSFAARGGVRMSAPKALPAAPKSSTRNSTVNNSKTTTQSNQQARTNQSSTGWGSAMRNIGLLAGGMFLGSMLSSLFGWGGMGFMADILGVMFNIVLLLVIVSLLTRLWRKFKGRGKTDFDDEAYRRGYEAAKREERFRHSGTTIDVTPIDDEQDKKKGW